MIYKNGDDIAVSIARSFERLEERIDSAESRIYARLADLEDKMDCANADLAHELAEIRGGIGEIARGREFARELSLAE